jgi:hypothetical protein
MHELLQLAGATPLMVADVVGPTFAPQRLPEIAAVALDGDIRAVNALAAGLEAGAITKVSDEVLRCLERIEMRWWPGEPALEEALYRVTMALMDREPPDSEEWTGQQWEGDTDDGSPPPSDTPPDPPPEAPEP